MRIVTTVDASCSGSPTRSAPRGCAWRSCRRWARCTRAIVSLVAQGRRRADRVWLSIFVNPTQFDDPRDYTAYPRTLEARSRGVSRGGRGRGVCARRERIRAAGAQTWVEVTELAKPLCGRSRPGHFRGVATIVAKLLLAAKPHFAIFGEKDFQQLAVIRRLVRDLGFDVEIVGAPTLREADGLALSSRNARLDPEARRQARVLSQALGEAERAVAAGERSGARLLALVAHRDREGAARRDRLRRAARSGFSRGGAGRARSAPRSSRSPCASRRRRPGGGCALDRQPGAATAAPQEDPPCSERC